MNVMLLLARKLLQQVLLIMMMMIMLMMVLPLPVSHLKPLLYPYSHSLLTILKAISS